MMPPQRPRNSRQARSALQYALSTVARPNPLVLAWRWRYELGIGIGMPAALYALTGWPGLLATLGALAALTGVTLSWTPARKYLIARAWCIITPHRVRAGCVQAWIHSRYGKLPIVLFTTRQPFGERVYLWCRAGTSSADFASALPVLVAACWAADIRINGHERYAQLVALDVIRHLPPEDHQEDIRPDRRAGFVPAARTAPDDTSGPESHPAPPNRKDIGPVA